MANYELVVLPLIIALLFFTGAGFFFLWFRKTSRRSPGKTPGKLQTSVFGLSLLILGGFSLFISLFFVITG